MAFTFTALCYMLALLLTAVLILTTLHHIIAFDELKAWKDEPFFSILTGQRKNLKTDPKDLSNTLNLLVLPEYVIHFFFCVMFFCAAEWLTLCLNQPLLSYHIWRYKSRPAYQSSFGSIYDPISITFDDTVAYCQKEGWCKLAFYLFSFFYYLYGMIYVLVSS